MEQEGVVGEKRATMMSECVPQREMDKEREGSNPEREDQTQRE